MVYFLRWRDPSVLLALLAEGVLSDVSITNTLPTPAVAFLYSWVPLILFIMSVGQFLVLLAKLPFRKLRTAGIAAGSFGFPWQNSSPLFGHKESPGRF
jgi:hypothetical protein